MKDRENHFTKIKCQFTKSIQETQMLVYMIQFSSVAQSCLTLRNPMNCSTPGLPVHHQLPEFTQTHGLPWKQTDHSVIFEIASKYCISDSFVDLDVELFALEMNKDHSAVFEIASKYCILDSC